MKGDHKIKFDFTHAGSKSNFLTIVRHGQLVKATPTLAGAGEDVKRSAASTGQGEVQCDAGTITAEDGVPPKAQEPSLKNAAEEIAFHGPVRAPNSARR